MTSSEQALRERRLRGGIRTDLAAWARFAMRSLGQTPAPHHLLVLQALERISETDSGRLILLLPPGSAKSTYASKVFPAWYLARHPRSSIIAASHTARLAEHFGRGVRGLVDEHSARLGIRITQNARASGRFLTDQGGEYFSIGVNGAVTGRRADLALIDDPISSFRDAESLRARQHLWEWFRTELVTRLKPGGRVVVIMTRWHTDDLAGRLIAQGGWSVLRLPALADAADELGRAPGDALWPEWEDAQALRDKRGLLGERHFSALFQQSPQSQTGKIFDVSQVPLIDSLPDGISVRAWDLAGTEDISGDPDWTVGIKLVRDDGDRIFIDDVVRFRAAPAEVAARIRAVAELDGTATAVGLPQDPGQAGKSQVMFLTQMLAGYRVIATPESGKKALRALPIGAQFSQGTIAARRARWNTALLDELASFPDGQKDDQVDALSRAFDLLLMIKPPARFARLAFSER